MRNFEFEQLLSKKTSIKLPEIEELFSKFQDEYDVVLEILTKYDIDKQVLGRIWGDYMGFAFVVPLDSIIKEEYIHKLGLDNIKELKSIPLYKMGKAITVATSDPQNPYLQDKLEKILGELVSVVFCFPFDIDNCLKHHKLT